MDKKTLRRVLSFCLAPALLAVATPAFAQINEAVRQSGQILRDQQLRQQEDRLRMQSRRPPANLQGTLPPAPAATNNGCWNINTITLTGANNMPQEKQDSLIKGYEHRCLGVVDVQQLLSDITRYYIEKGYTTTRAYLPQQDLTTKKLTLDIVEGTVEKLKSQQDKGRLYLDNAFPGVEGSVLNLRDIEQGIDQLNRMPSNNATIDIAPGTTPGQSVIAIKNAPTKPWHVSVNLDNYGSRSTGQEEASATLGYDDLFGYNDMWSLTARRSTDIDDFTKHSNSFNGFVSIPYGYTTFTYGMAVSDYDSKLLTPGPILALDGHSNSEFLAIDHVLFRDQGQKFTLSATLTKKEQENFIAGNQLAVSSRPLTILDLGGTYTNTFFGGSSSLNVLYSQGMDILGAYGDVGGMPDNAPHAQFQKLSLNASWSRPFQFAGQDFTWSSAVTAQKGFDVLYGTEQISIGGFYTVRGFYEDSLANDTGAYIRNDLSLRRALGTLWGQDLVFKPYIALDGGTVHGPSRDTPHGSMLGGGVGMTLSAGDFAFDIFTGKPLISPGSIGPQGFHALSRLTYDF